MRELKVEQVLRAQVRERYPSWKKTAEFWDRLLKRAPTLPPVEVLENLVVQKYREGFRCPYCGREMSATPRRAYTWTDAILWTLEHKTPRALEGSDSPENLTVACQGCNVVKGTMRADTYMSVFRSLPDDVRLRWLDESFRGMMRLRFEREKLMRQILALLDIKEEIPRMSDEEWEELAETIIEWFRKRKPEHA